MVGTTTALLIGAGISAGSNVAGTIMRNKAAQKAADIQSQAADKYAGTAKDLISPWVTTGAGAMTSLGNMMGVTPGTMPLLPAEMGGNARARGDNPQTGWAMPRPFQPPQGPPQSHQDAVQARMAPPPPQMALGGMGLSPNDAYAERMTQSGYAAPGVM